MSSSIKRRNRNDVSAWWNPEDFAAQKPYLEARMKMMRAVREYFDGQGFWEVETPILQVCPVMDTHIHGFATDMKGVDLQYQRTLYLHTSPEFAMKKLLVAGLPKIYQICHVFRNAEDSARHSPEFTMIEWYRAEADYRPIMEDCKGLLRHCAKAIGIEEYRHRDKKCDPFKEWQEITVVEAFRKYAGLNLEDFLSPHPSALCADSLSPRERAGPAKREGEGTDERFRNAVSSLGLHTSPDDRWDDLFFRVMGEKIEPHLGMGAPTLLCDYPVSMASLSRRKPGDPRYAERFEMYVCGIELCNAFSELTDADEQRARFAEEMDNKEKIYGERYPVDDDFIAALEHGMPESGGNAIGLDRLAMLASGADDIAQVLWTGKP